eukprot:Sspe_Gene.28495::Locus_12971_Transcript_1_2_Confidence_0.400_Length_1758::g.28495::m.28495
MMRRCSGLMSAHCRVDFVCEQPSDQRVSNMIKHAMRGKARSDQSPIPNIVEGHCNTMRILRILEESRSKGAKLAHHSYATAMWCILLHGNPTVVPLLFEDMDRKGITPSPYCWHNLLASYAAVGDVQTIKDIIAKNNLTLTTQAANVCIGQLGRRGFEGEALVFFKDCFLGAGLKPDLHTWTRLIGMCSTVAKAHEIYNVMCTRGIQPTVVHINCLLRVCRKAGDTISAEEYLNTAERMAVHGKVCRPNTITYTIMIGIYRDRGKFDKVVATYTRMRQLRITPNTATYVEFIRACRALATTPDDYHSNVAKAALKQSFNESFEPDSAPAVELCKCYLKTRDEEGLLWLVEFMTENAVPIPEYIRNAESKMQAALQRRPEGEGEGEVTYAGSYFPSPEGQTSPHKGPCSSPLHSGISTIATRRV